jgi:hypothetical protein
MRKPRAAAMRWSNACWALHRNPACLAPRDGLLSASCHRNCLQGTNGSFWVSGLLMTARTRCLKRIRQPLYRETLLPQRKRERFAAVRAGKRWASKTVGKHEIRSLALVGAEQDSDARTERHAPSSRLIRSRIARNCARASLGLRVCFPVRLSIGEPLASDALDCLSSAGRIVNPKRDAMVVTEIELGSVAVQVSF